MAESSKGDKPAENIFKIMDQIVRQLNRTKKMFIWLIISMIVIFPATHIITFALLGGQFPEDGNGGWQNGRPGPPGNFGIVPIIVVSFVIAWIVIGVRQWLILSKWTKRYELYKELQKKIDEKLDDDENDKSNTQ